MRMAQSGIVRHHRESPAAARARLHQSFRNSDYWGPNGTPQARGWARVILGQGRVAAVEVWALRGPTQITVTVAQASAAMGQVARTVHRLVQ
jgi:hypothetical protein